MLKRTASPVRQCVSGRFSSSERSFVHSDFCTVTCLARRQLRDRSLRSGVRGPRAGSLPPSTIGLQPSRIALLDTIPTPSETRSNEPLN
jgi:hypothetical protein